ncbi:hypothetical protein LWF15_09925 [Kineosporia rhizophila]|uniref:calcium-binding protein n=1 Tax=Kineosporia rhizophila TaxID=84633 RepID=UPI001E55FE28|nr:calcium-binding protein [Kineosporia rhizophila]MCE0535829.1 hypothetical protein [Kineosporia rhizophila]
MPSYRAASVLALAVTPLALALPAQAQTTTARASVSSDGASLTYSAAMGQVNRIAASVEWDEDNEELIYLIDDRVPVRTGNGCEHLGKSDRTSIRCIVQPAGSDNPYPTLAMNLRDKDDNVEFHNQTAQAFYFAEFRLGTGKDTLDSTHATKGDGSFVWGQDGPDRITTGSVATVQGGDGPDTLTTSGNYSDLDGGAGEDKLWGGVGTQFLRGGADDDVVHGGAGRDTIYGGPGNDRLYGEQHRDKVLGEAGDDFINGGKGVDKLIGGPGKDMIKP